MRIVDRESPNYSKGKFQRSGQRPSGQGFEFGANCKTAELIGTSFFAVADKSPALEAAKVAAIPGTRPLGHSVTCIYDTKPSIMSHRLVTPACPS